MSVFTSRAAAESNRGVGSVFQVTFAFLHMKAYKKLMKAYEKRIKAYKKHDKNIHIKAYESI